MAMFIFLDSAPLSLLARPALSAEAQPIHAWVAACDAAGHRIIIPEIVDYKVRREFLRAGRQASVNKLNYLMSSLTYLPITTAAIVKAAELWAQTRQQGRPTAHDQNIDVDVILAAQALTLGVAVNDLVAATSNERHLSSFVPADLWSNISP